MPKVLLGLIGVQIVCKGYQQMCQVGNGLTGLPYDLIIGVFNVTHLAYAFSSSALQNSFLELL